MEIFVSVNGQKLKIPCNTKKIISGSRAFVKLTFMLSTDWDNMTVHAYIKQGEDIYDTVLDNNNSCYIPSGVKSGIFSLMLYGIGGVGGTVIATTEEVKFMVDAPLYAPNGEESGGYDEDYVATINEVRAYLGIT